MTGWCKGKFFSMLNSSEESERYRYGKNTMWAARSQAAVVASQPSPYRSIPMVLFTLKTATELWGIVVKLYKRAAGNWINGECKDQRQSVIIISQNTARWIQTDLRPKFAFSCRKTIWEAALEGPIPVLTQIYKLNLADSGLIPYLSCFQLHSNIQSPT